MRTLFIFFALGMISFFASGQTIPFTESFENGIVKWNNMSSGGTVEASATGAFIGKKSLHITGTGAGAGLSLDFAVSQEPTVIFYYVKVTGGEGGVVAVGNGHSATNAAYYGEITGGNFVVTGNAGATTLCPVASNEWVKVEVRNLNFVAMTYDIYINGELKGKKLPFRGSVPGISTIDIYNQAAGAEAWWDAVYVGMSGFDYPEFTGVDVCKNTPADIDANPAVALDSAGINIAGTTFSIPAVSNDSSVNFMYPYMETTFIDDNGSSSAWAGNMFDIKAKKDFVIYGFDINNNGTTAASAKVYYRKGTYVGYTTSNVGWILLDSVDVVPNPSNGAAWLGLTKSLVIPAGETYGIYICSSNGIDYTDGTGSNEIVSNNDLTITCGHGGLYFNLTNTPRVWNGRIYYKVAEKHQESQIMTTMFASNNAYAGNMFDVFVKNDIVIDSLDVNITTNGWVKLYVRNGTVVGNNTSNAGWSLIDSVTVVASGQDIPTRVPLSNRVLLQAGSLYGLYVCNEGTMRYTGIVAGTNDVYTDSNMVVTGYYGGTNAFSCTSSRMWNGTLYYSVRNVDSVDVSTQNSTSTYAGLYARGFYYTSPNDHIITGLRVPNEAAGTQYVEVVRFKAVPPYYSNTTNDFVSLGRYTKIAGNVIIPVNIFVHEGDVIGVLGTRYSGTITTMSWTANPTYLTSILNDTVTFYRLGMQADFINAQAHDLWTENATWVGRIEMYTEPVTLHGGPDSVMINVHTPMPDLGPDGDYCKQTVLTLDPGYFSTYDWSTSETSASIVVDTTGVPYGSPFDVWVSVTDMYGCTGSDTITISFIDCTGIEEENMMVSVYPNPSDDVFYIKADNVQDEMLVQVFSLDGRLVSEKILNDSFGSIDMSDELPGVYAIRITIKDQVKEMRVVLQ